MSSATMANSNKRRKLNSNNETQNPQINSIIVRDFGGTMFVGWINQFFEKEQMWEVIYEDGDKEDLNRKELLRYLQPDINQHFGEFYKVTFPANEALGVVMAPKPNEEKGQNGVNNNETTSTSAANIPGSNVAATASAPTIPVSLGLRRMPTKWDQPEGHNLGYNILCHSQKLGWSNTLAYRNRTSYFKT